MFTLFKSTKLSALAAIYNECLPAAALFETLFRLSMSLSRSGACGVVSGDDDDSSLRFGTLS